MLLSVYIINRQIRSKSLHAIEKRAQALRNSAIRMAIVILSNCLTWTPVVIQQLIILSGVEINLQIIMWIFLSCLPINLLINLIFVIKNTFNIDKLHLVIFLMFEPSTSLIMYGSIDD